MGLLVTTGAINTPMPFGIQQARRGQGPPPHLIGYAGFAMILVIFRRGRMLIQAQISQRVSMLPRPRDIVEIEVDDSVG